MTKLIQSILAITALLSVVFGVYFYVDNRYALADDLNKTKQRLEYKIQADQLSNVQDRIWKIEDRFEKRTMDITTKEELKRLNQQKADLKSGLDKLEKSSK